MRVMSPPIPAIKLLRPITILVGSGSVPPSCENIFENVGTTKSIMITITKIATAVTTAG